MKKSIKKKLATPIILGILIVYAGLFTQIYYWTHELMTSWLEIFFFAIAGFGWAVPTALAIKWIEKEPNNGQ